MMNLHGIARNVIQAAHAEEPLTLYQSTGQVNEKGRLTPIYAEPLSVSGQVQTENDEKLYHAYATSQDEITRRIYLYTEKLRPAGIVRPQARGGDMIERGDGTWWLVTGVLDDFSGAGWVCVRVTLQVNKPDFSASPWYPPKPPVAEPSESEGGAV